MKITFQITGRESKYSIFNFKEDIHSSIFGWFQNVRFLNVPISGPPIQEKAKIFATFFKKEDFKLRVGKVRLARFFLK